MLVLFFTVGEERYAMPAAGIVEVLPLVALRPVPLLPPEIAGLLDYRGTVVPVVDLERMLRGVDCPPLYSSRILLTRHPLPDGREKLLGLRVARACRTQRVPAGQLRPSELRTAPFLGQVVLHDGGLAQLVEVRALLGDAVRERLFPPDAEPPRPGVGDGHPARG